jgi:hypothetical protein
MARKALSPIAFPFPGIAATADAVLPSNLTETGNPSQTLLQTQEDRLRKLASTSRIGRTALKNDLGEKMICTATV